ncbi:MAG: stage III sporulation protein AD [Lachnospiraceae bacterium]|nr:stage III sporulation protein AD [Lachnospiraceae bacterium]
MIYKVMVIALLGVIMAMFLRTQRAEYSVFLSICIAVLILFCVLGLFSSAKEQLASISAYMTMDNQYYGLLFKMIGITYLCEFCSGICKDSGYQAIGSQIEIFGKISILLAGVPILMTLLETIQGFSV